LAELWQSWGVEPSVVLGHSAGEYVAACVAGVFSLEDGLKLIAERGRLMQALAEDGEMMAVFTDEAQVVEALQPYGRDLAIASLNGPRNIVISGKRPALRAVRAVLQAQGVRTTPLKVSHAFHSPLMEPMLAAFEEVARKISFFPAKISIISNVTGRMATTELATQEYWCRHLRQPVRFAASIETMHQQGCEVFLEAGPQPILAGMGRHCLPEAGSVWLPSLRQGQSDWQQMLRSLGKLYVRGVPVNWSGFDRDYTRGRVALPTYPFQRGSYWIESATSDAGQRRLFSQSPPEKTAQLGELPALNKTGMDVEEGFLAPRTPVEETLAKIWTQVLGINQVSVNADFFALGGDSLLAIQVMSRVDRTFQVKLPLRCLFETSTVAGLATAIVLGLAEETEPALMSFLEKDLESPTNT
jgi:acyl transferase domain-containing protein/acyl carrier protein